MEIKLATVRAAYSDGTNSGDFAQNVPSIAMISQPIKSASLRRNKEFEQIFNPDAKVGYAMVVGYDGA
jgi:hypothetical protein